MKLPSPVCGKGAGGEGESLLDHAKTLRAKQTEAEQRLWYHLRANRLNGLKFKRQKPMGPYIVDFVCIEHRLIIEADGGQHEENQDYDLRRDNCATRAGISSITILEQ